MHLGMFEGLALILLLAAALGIVFTKLKQPLLIAFIVVGIVVGPVGFGLVEPQGREIIKTLAEFGISVLLFVVGLKMDLGEIRSSGKTSALVAAGKAVVIFALAFAISLLFGAGLVDGVYIGMCAVFSSTIIVIKLLADRHETESLFGRIAIGTLIVEDIAVILAMVIITSMGAADSAGSGTDTVRMVIGGAVSLAVIVLLSAKVFPRLLRTVAKSGELLVLFAVAWAVGIAALFNYLGFGMEIGAFVAGVSLASNPFREAISVRLLTLRDFLLLFFFIDLGLSLDLATAIQQLPVALVLSVLVVLGTPVIVTAIMGRLGYRRMTGFSTGVALGQISEFSLVLAALGVTVGHISQSTLGVITMVALISIAASTYMMRYAPQIYRAFEKPLKVFQVKRFDKEDSDDEGTSPAEFIVFGLGRYGKKISRGLELKERTVLGVDFDPRLVRKAPTKYMHYTYGDIEDPNLAEHLPITAAQWAVSTTPFVEPNIELMHNLRAAGYKGHFAATVHASDDIEQLQEAGVDLVLTPFMDAAEQAVDLLLGEDVRELSLTDVTLYGDE